MHPQTPYTVTVDHPSRFRYLRNRRFWNEDQDIRPGKIVGWLLEAEDGGWRIKR